jgi:hypothetical protein
MLVIAVQVLAEGSYLKESAASVTVVETMFEPPPV